MLTTTKKNLLTSTALAACLFTISLPPNTTLANPKGGQVVAGEATITQPNSATVLINQTSQNTVVDWQRFDIAPDETTRFMQPNSNSWTLNRVTGNLGPTAILGTIHANGNIAIVNPDGIVFGQGSRIDVNSLIATTSDIRTDDFMAGRMLFNIPGNPAASIINEGNVSVAELGLVAFVAPGVRNSGVITARFGSVSLAAGNVFTLDLYGDGLINLVADDEIVQEVFDVATGKPVTDLVKNDGTIRANGGLVALTAATARRVVNSVVNNTGVIEANTIGVHKGKITLGAQTTSTKVVKPNLPTPQRVKVSGTLNAYAAITRVTLPKERPLVGGTIEITGEWIDLVDAALNVYGTNGGGTVLVGGDYMGGNGEASIIAQHNITMETTAVQTATYLSANSGTSINADAIKNGDGGKVILWSDDTTATSATISARGGTQSGDGGFVETSGKQNLATSGFVNVSAGKGSAGTWLLDPYDLIISNTNTIFDIEVSGGTQTFSAFENGSQISVDTIQNALNTGSNVQLIAQHGIYSSGNTIRKTSGGDASLKMVAGHEMQFSNFSISSSKNELDVAFGAPSVSWKKGNIETNGGNILIGSNVDSELNIDGTFESMAGKIELFSGDSPIYVSGNLSATSGDITINSRSGQIEFDQNNLKIDTTSGNVIIRSETGKQNLGKKYQITSGFGYGSGPLIATQQGDISITSETADIFAPTRLQTSAGGKIEISTLGNLLLQRADHKIVNSSANINYSADEISANYYSRFETNGGDLNFSMERNGDFGSRYVTSTFGVYEIKTNGGDVNIISKERFTPGIYGNIYKGVMFSKIYTSGGDFNITSNGPITFASDKWVDLGGGSFNFHGSSVQPCWSCKRSDLTSRYSDDFFFDFSDGVDVPYGVRLRNGKFNISINKPLPPAPVNESPSVGNGMLDDVQFTNDGSWGGSGALTDLFADDGVVTDLGIVVSGHPAGIQYEVSDGELSFSLIPGANIQSGSYTVFVSATDDAGQSVSRQFTLTIIEPAPVTPPTPVNTPPIEGTGTLDDITFINDGTWTGSGTLTDLFADDSGAIDLGIIVSGHPTGIQYDVSNGQLSFSLAPGVNIQSGTYTIVVKATDSAGQSVTRQFELAINEPAPVTPPTPVDTPPTEGTGSLNDITFTNDGTWSGSGSLSNLFSDDNGIAGLDITVSGNPTGIQFDTSNGAVQFSLVPGATLQSGTYTITITATDASGQSVPREFKIKAEEPAPIIPPTPVDNPPTKGSNPIDEITYQNGSTGLRELNISNLFSDDGGSQNLAVTFSGVPTGVTATPNKDGTVSFISANGIDLPVRDHTIIITAEDASGQTASRKITLVVTSRGIIATTPILAEILPLTDYNNLIQNNSRELADIFRNNLISISHPNSPEELIDNIFSLYKTLEKFNSINKKILFNENNWMLFYDSLVVIFPNASEEVIKAKRDIQREANKSSLKLNDLAFDIVWNIITNTVLDYSFSKFEFENPYIDTIVKSVIRDFVLELPSLGTKGGTIGYSVQKLAEIVVALGQLQLEARDIATASVARGLAIIQLQRGNYVDISGSLKMANIISQQSLQLAENAERLNGQNVILARQLSIISDMIKISAYTASGDIKRSRLQQGILGLKVEQYKNNPVGNNLTDWANIGFSSYEEYARKIEIEFGINL